MKLVVNWLIAALAIVISAYLLPGVKVEGFLTALVLAVVLAAVNAFVKPVVVLLTLPLTIITFGLFLLVINALLILLAAAIVPGFAVANFWWAFLFAIVLSAVSWVLDHFNGHEW